MKLRLQKRRIVNIIAWAVMMGNCFFVSAQKKVISKVWVSDHGDGTYTNPVLHADYSDPDAIVVGEDYYMVASSFDAVPGLPILHSKDLVNWQLIAHALPVQIPAEHFSSTQHGNGVWAPAIRYHNHLFYIFYPDPDFGIYVITASNIKGPWSAPKLIEAGKGLIDPCPFWDDDGKAYLVHAFAGSRAGIKNMLTVQRLNKNADSTIDEGVLIYDAHGIENTVEGPKMYKRNGYYYVFAPAGGVATGYQMVLRSKNIYGPYERKIVMQQGVSQINGPHQGAWVHTAWNEDWFLHFQDKNVYGRVVHLQPMRWKDDWPVIGTDADGDGIGNPVIQFKKPKTISATSMATPTDSDEFENHSLGLQWQWQANPQSTWAFVYQGNLRMYAANTGGYENIWNNPAVLLQKLPAENFTASIKCNPQLTNEGENFGFTMLGTDYAYLAIKKQSEDSLLLQYVVCKQADKTGVEQISNLATVGKGDLYFKIKVSQAGKCNFFYGSEEKLLKEVAEEFVAKPGKWIGAKIGFFCSSKNKTNDAGFVDIDWIRFTKE